ncbi:hypothetical protein CCP4SC76_1810002 [Gammaproteobacteria bacterium]
MTSQSLVSVEFHGYSLVTFQHNGDPYVAMKPIVEAIGLDWASQLQRVKRNEILSEGMVIMPSSGGVQEMVSLPLKLLNGWLFGVDVERVKPEIRETILTYQRECYDVLWNHWSSQPPAPKPNPTRDHLDACILLLRSAAEDLKFSSSSLLGGYQRLEQHLGMRGLLPGYAVDAPVSAVAGSSEVTKSASELLKEFGVNLSIITIARTSTDFSDFNNRCAVLFHSKGQMGFIFPSPTPVKHSVIK